MSALDDQKIERMQHHLGTIRKVAGWTADRFGDEIGVTRQTISNLERQKTKLTKTQYLAIRTVLNQEIVESGNQGLASVLRALIDDPVEDDSEMGEADNPVGAMQGQSNITKILSSDAPEVRDCVMTLLAGAASLTPLLPTVAAAVKAAKKMKG